MGRLEGIIWYAVVAYCITATLALVTHASIEEEKQLVETQYQYKCNIEQLSKGTALTCNNGHMYYVED